MARDRGEIEKSDFPLVRRGYDPAAVREHLRAIADELERLGQGAGADTASASTAEHVRGILAAAEEAAAEIKRQGSERAREIVQAAEREAGEIRSGAGDAVRRQAASVAQLTADLLDRGGAAEGEIGALAAQLRSAAERLLRGRRGAAQEDPVELSAAGAGEEAYAAAEALHQSGSESFAQPAGPEPAAGVPDAAAPVAAVAPAAGGKEPQPARHDVDGARLIALNMALSGEPREETDRYLAENFDLPDRAALVEEVYAAIEA